MSAFVKLHYLPSLPFINIAGKKTLWEGSSQEKRRRRGKGKEKQCSLVWGEIHDWLDCLGLTVLTVDFYYFFPPPTSEP